MIVALIIATLVPLIFLYVIYTLDLYGTGSFQDIALSFVWGGIAVGLAFFINNALVYQYDVSISNLKRYAAPFVEEILKALVLLYLIRKPQFTYFVDGAIYGFAAGIGFAVFENYLYIYQGMDAGVGTAVSRVVSANLMHASASAVVGIALGMSRFQRFSGRALFLVGGLALAMLFHAGYNNLVDRVESSLLLLYAAVGGFVGIGFVWFMIKRGLGEQKQWIQEKLGAADRVTTQEAAVVNHLEDAHELLAPLVEIFGQDKADQIEDFLLLQARLGIKRKTLDKLEHNERMRKSVEKEMGEIRAQMDEIRRTVGAYTMVSVRSIFPMEDNPVWGRLEGVIQKNVASRPATGGVNLFALAGTRARARQTPDDQVEEEAG